MRIRSLTGAVVFFLLTARGQKIATDDIPVLTVCEALSDLDRYEGKSIIVVGRFGWTEEGNWLSEDCKLKIVRGGRAFSPQISTAYIPSEFAPPPELPKNFAWDKRLLQQKAAHLKRTTKLHKYKPGKYDEKWVAMFGRLETRLPRQLRHLANGLSVTTYGFGHQSASPAQLIPAAEGFLTIE